MQSVTANALVLKGSFGFVLQSWLLVLQSAFYPPDFCTELEGSNLLPMATEKSIDSEQDKNLGGGPPSP